MWIYIHIETFVCNGSLQICEIRNVTLSLILNVSLFMINFVPFQKKALRVNIDK